jgi:hypothetical protein
MDNIVSARRRARENNKLIRMVDIPIVHGYAALVANATDVVGLCLLWDGIERYSSTSVYSTILTLAG